ncbi:MAG: glycosyltransferase family 1 protein [Phycisphaerales bacterium]
MRVMLFTDTLGDVNGVSRFIRNAADQALAGGHDFTVVTSTNFDVPDRPNIVNVKPLYATRMPKYENLELAFPPALDLVRLARRRRPDVIHISTPGSVGLAGRWAARALGVPVAGVYHTDFPAYIEKLFHHESLTLGCEQYMRVFYRAFSAIFTRSDDYAQSLLRLGLPRDRLHTLRPGIRVEEFHPRFHDASAWERAGSPAGAVRLIYVGRVSVEKNLPMLTRVWREADRQLRAQGVSAELNIIGDGPYRAQMQEELRGTRARFLGFRYGAELSALYAGAHLFVFPSTTDTLGQVVMESQASGMPVLVTDQGGPKEVVRNGETGFVLPAHDERAWASRIVCLAGDDALRSRMGLAAHAFMQEYSMQRSFEHFWEVHRQVHERTRAPRAGD